MLHRMARSTGSDRRISAESTIQIERRNSLMQISGSMEFTSYAYVENSYAFDCTMLPVFSPKKKAGSTSDAHHIIVGSVGGKSC
jgi:hypothetical protein